MDTNIINNKRIAQNTIYLYLRQLIIMAVSLYTSRVILKILGIEDFGIYNVVGGIVILFTFLNFSLSNATQRFLNYEMGKGDNNSINRVFCMSINVHIIFALIIFLFAETVGLWVIYNKANIPEYRMNAALYAYQFSIFSICLQMLRVPYNAIIIAYEKMKIYAYLSILDVMLRLGIVYLLLVLPFDKLIIYAALIPIINIGILVINMNYAINKFETAKFRFIWDNILFRRMLSFSGWSLLGGIANTGTTYGMNLILNLFCGVIVNAAIGIANQVNAAVGSLVSSFQVAFSPQIVKSYAVGDYNGFYSLIMRTSRFSYYIMLFITAPVILFVDPLLNAWLVIVPKFAASFTQLILLYTLIDSISGPFWYAANATGKIKWYYIITSLLLLLTLPISFILLKLGVSVVKVVAVKTIINVFVFIARVIILRNICGFPLFKYFYEVFRHIFPSILVFFVLIYVPFRKDNLFLCFIEMFFVFIIFVICFILFGIKTDERSIILKFIKK